MPISQERAGEGREALVTRTFVDLADNLVDSFDLIDLLTVLSARSVELLGAAAAGILLADDRGRLRVLAASDDRTETLELYQLQNNEGPCLDCYASGKPVASGDLAADSPWPAFAAACVQVGFHSVHALPLRLRGDVLGALNLFMVGPGGLSVADCDLGQALADAASISIVQDHVVRTSGLRQQQLQHALDSRVLIEQGKGMISEHAGLDMDQAFVLLRGYARRHRQPLTDVAARLVNRELAIVDLSPPS